MREIGIPEADKTADPSDTATQREEESLRHAMLEHGRRMRRDQVPVPDETLKAMADKEDITDPIDRADFFALHRWEFPDCDDCGLEIGEKRLAVAIRNRLCLHCATIEERRNKR